MRKRLGKIDIKGDIVADDFGEVYDFLDITSTYPKKVQQILNDDEDEEVEVNIASYGGDVFAASEIYTMLRNSQKNVTVNIQGLAASAASVIAMAGDTVRMAPTSQIMIHKASVLADGNSDDFEHQAEVLSSIDESIALAYELKTGLKQTEILQLMQNETWMNAKKAIDKGFADEIMFVNDDEESDLVVENSLRVLPSKKAINKLKNLMMKDKQITSSAINKADALRNQKLAILLEKEK